jgi:hypothetical protein
MVTNRKWFNLAAVVLGLAVSGSWTPAQAYTGDLTINFLAVESPQLMVIKTTPALPTGTCTYNDEAYLEPTGSSSQVDYSTAAPLVLAAYLYDKTVQLNLIGCTASGRPIVVGLIVKN